MNNSTAIWIMAVSSTTAFSVGMALFYGMLALGAELGVALAIGGCSCFGTTSLVSHTLARHYASE